MALCLKQKLESANRFMSLIYIIHGFRVFFHAHFSSIMYTVQRLILELCRPLSKQFHATHHSFDDTAINAHLVSFTQKVVLTILRQPPVWRSRSQHRQPGLLHLLVVHDLCWSWASGRSPQHHWSWATWKACVAVFFFLNWYNSCQTQAMVFKPLPFGKWNSYTTMRLAHRELDPKIGI